MKTGLYRDRPARVWLLLSGGIDSAACLAFYLKNAYCVNCLHVTYGQPGSDSERKAAARVAGHYDVPLTPLSWTGSSRLSPGEILGRNAFLITAALLEIQSGSGLLGIGIHARDCVPRLFHLLSRYDGPANGPLL